MPKLKYKKSYRRECVLTAIQNVQHAGFCLDILPTLINSNGYRPIDRAEYERRVKHWVGDIGTQVDWIVEVTN